MKLLRASCELPIRKCKRFRSLSSASNAQSVEWTPSGLRISWADIKAEDWFHPSWLYENAETNYHQTGQKLFSGFAEKQISHVKPSESHISVDFADGSEASLSWEFLWKYRPSSLIGRTPDPMLRATAVKRFPISAHEDDWMFHLLQDGIVILEGAPPGKQTLEQIAEPMGGLVDTMYDRIWDLTNEFVGADVSGRANLAYSQAALALHQDLVYFESPPGIQMLSWQRADETIQGGLSTFLDSGYLLQLFRERHPEHFRTFCQLPATFQKDQEHRSPPQRVFYRTPHITLNEREEIINFIWSPPFEGPLMLSLEQTEEYYKARQAFDSILTEIPKLEIRMKAGEVAIWNNKRMLHGRTAISGEGVRQAFGAYTSLDEFLNRMRGKLKKPFLSHAYHGCF